MRCTLVNCIHKDFFAYKLKHMLGYTNNRDPRFSIFEALGSLIKLSILFM